MLKKIKVQDIKPGMFLQEICGSWIDHPFWKKSFEISESKDIATMQTCGILEVWIDTDKGIDVGRENNSSSVETTQEDIEKKLLLAAKSDTTIIPKSQLKDELVHARKLHGKAREVVTSLFNEARMGKALQLEEVSLLVSEINLSITRNSEAFLSLSRIKNKDNYTYLHSVAVCGLMIALAKQLGLNQSLVKDLGMAGLLHDVGKMMMPEDILNKPGRLTDDEFDIIKSHPLRGWEILDQSPDVSAIALDVCRHHHERVDGMGYPDKLSGEELSLFARMGAVCDVYDAITSDRIYKVGWEPSEALRKMAEWQEGHFDNTVFHAFVKTIGIYPSGTLVKLKSSRLAVVIEQSEKNLLTPIVKVFFSTSSNAPLNPELIDLSQSTDSIANAESAEKWGFDLKKITGL